MNLISIPFNCPAVVCGGVVGVGNVYIAGVVWMSTEMDSVEKYFRQVPKCAVAHTLNKWCGYHASTPREGGGYMYVVYKHILLKIN